MYLRNKDPEPDLFYFNFNGYSGKMVLNPVTQKFTPLLTENLNIEFESTTSSWKINTPDGVQYIFKKQEKTTNYNYSMEFGIYDGTYSIHNPNYIDTRQPVTTTSWYLDSIISPLNDYIAFEYDNITHKVASQLSVSNLIYRMTNFQLSGQQSGSNYTSSILNGWYDYTYASQSVTDEVYLKKILTKDGLVVDLITSDRNDMEVLTPTHMNTSTENKAQKLDRIEISHSSFPGRKRKFHLYQSYFSDFEPYFKNRRLRLDSLNYTDLTEPSAFHRFYYGEGSLPSKTSNAVDHWGFYNGASSNDSRSNTGWGTFHATSIPSYQLQTGGTIQGANRNSNEEKSKVAVLNRIVYPTGGAAYLEYELNDYPRVVSVATITKDFRSVSSGIPGDTVNRLTHSNTFTLTAPTSVVLYYNAYSPTSPKTCHSTTNIINYTGITNMVYGTITGPSYYREFKYNDWTIQCAYDIGEGTIEVTLQPGTYTINTYVIGPPYGAFRTLVGVRYPQQISVPPFDDKVKLGGLRIKSILLDDGIKRTRKHYRYVKEISGIEASSGLLLAPINYFFETGVINNNYMSPGAGLLFTTSYSGTYVCGQSNTVSPLGSSANGNSIGYDRVEEYVENSEESGKTVYYFSNTPELIMSTMIAGVPNEVAYNNGYLTRKEYFSGDNILLKSEGYVYTKNEGISPTVKGLKMFSLPFAANPFPVTYQLPDLMKFYDNKIEWWRKIRDTVTVYHQNLSQNSITEYEYDPTNYAIKEITGKNSKGQITKEKYWYPHNTLTETTTAPGVLLHMQDINMTGSPLKTERFLNNSRIDASITNFGENLQPVNIKKIKGSGFVNAIEFEQYDVDGNLLQYHETGSARKTTIWGYNKTRPVFSVSGLSFGFAEEAFQHIMVEMGFPGGLDDIDNLLLQLGDVKTQTQKDLLGTLNLKLKERFPLGVFQFQTFDLFNGVTSSIQPNSTIQFYTYDDVGRLTLIQDQDQHIVKKIQYNSSFRVPNLPLAGAPNTIKIPGLDYKHPLGELLYTGLSQVAYLGNGMHFNADPGLQLEMVAGSPLTGPGREAVNMTSWMGYFILDGMTLDPQQIYAVTYWEKDCQLQAVTSEGTETIISDQIIRQHGDWNLHKILFTNIGGGDLFLINMGMFGHIQELRLLPDGAQMTTYAYDSNGVLKSKCDKDYEVTYY
ncbi:MAG: hypothetical protein ACTHMC_17010 [Pseudobacter sp.]|uniref:hypothetical protein n=1 Tax=Pseudobacter sp. TaxID=2045420 RepID=UPI003F807C6C